jgi:uncharacterized membrane protein YdbT with pleckstrin-like domain
MSRYIEANLIRGEAVAYEAKPHWILFVSWRSLLTLGLLPLIDYVTSEFAVTNKRVIMKTGWISRRVLELNLHKIDRSMWINRSSGVSWDTGPSP